MTKLELYKATIEHIQSLIAQINEAIIMAEESGKDDTKSSAGDKYETGREMAQQNINRSMKQLSEINQKLIFMQNLNPLKVTDTIENGSVIDTNRGLFYLCTSAGQIKVSNQQFYAISSIAPIGRVFLGKKQGDEFNFNGLNYKILEVL